MATVYLARLSGVAGFSRLVAIKRLHPHLAREREFVEMFLDEARLAARIHHPNVVPIQEVGKSDDGYYLVMDYVEGDTFAHMLAKVAQSRSALPLGVVVRVLLDTLAGLHAAHELRDDDGEPLAIVHRDVSPQNILVGTDGVARLVDFGVARAASRLSTTRTGQLKGKLAYMAPEQMRSGGIDRRADLFACGIVLWEALASRRLFKADAEAETFNRVLYEPIVAPSTHRASVPEPLERVCLRALERDVDKRFPTAWAFAEALERAAGPLGLLGSPREVAQALDALVGASLHEQREARRSLLSRSEISGLRPQVPASPESLTRVEGNSRSDVSVDPRRAPAGLAAVPNGAAKVTSTAGLSAAPEALAPVTASLPASTRDRVLRGAVLGLAAVLLLFAGAWGSRRWSALHDAPAVSQGTPPREDSTVPPPAATPPPASAPAAGDIEIDDDLTTVTPASLPQAAPIKPSSKPGRAGAIAPKDRRPAPETTSAVPSAPVPDDLSRNPYR